MNPTPYQPHIFGTLEPSQLWAAFNGVAQRWQLDAVETVRLLKAKPQLPRATPPADAATIARIELLKDNALLLEMLYQDYPDRSRGAWVRRPMGVYGDLSPLVIMTALNSTVLAVTKPDSFPSALRGAEHGSDTLGLRHVRSLLAKGVGLTDGGYTHSDAAVQKIWLVRMGQNPSATL